MKNKLVQTVVGCVGTFSTLLFDQITFVNRWENRQHVDQESHVDLHRALSSYDIDIDIRYKDHLVEN
jgi:hypothetical protein